MRTLSKLVLLSLLLTGACAAKPAAATTPPPAARAGLQIGLTTVYVDDLEKAHRFYTEVLGFETKDDETNGPYRWLTVVAPSDPDGTQLHLALAEEPAAKAFQQAMFAQSQPAVMFYTDDVAREHARLAAKGATFTMPPTEVMPGVVIATLEDSVGNLIQLSQLDR